MKIRPKDQPVRLGIALDNKSHQLLQQLRAKMVQEQKRNVSLSEAVRFAIASADVK